MNPTDNLDNQNSHPETPRLGQTASENVQPQQAPIIGYCRATGKPLTQAEAVYVDGILYSKDQADHIQAIRAKEPPSPYTEPMVSVPKRVADVSPGWAFVLGLIPGVGAIYNQQYAKGMFHIIVFAALVSIVDRPGGGAFVGFLMSGWFFYMPFEAYHTAQKRQRGEAVDELSGLVSLPSGMKKLPVGPLALIGIGFLFLLDNLNLLRVDEVLRFWPVLMIAVGVILLMQRLQGAEDENASKGGSVHVD